MRIIVTPRAGLVIRDPQTAEVLPEGGAVKEDSSAWRRYEAAGDVTIRPEGAAAQADTDAASAKAKK